MVPPFSPLAWIVVLRVLDDGLHIKAFDVPLIDAHVVPALITWRKQAIGYPWVNLVLGNMDGKGLVCCAFRMPFAPGRDCYFQFLRAFQQIAPLLDGHLNMVCSTFFQSFSFVILDESLYVLCPWHGEVHGTDVLWHSYLNIVGVYLGQSIHLVLCLSP